MNSFNPLPVIELIGDPEENFYQLGLKDREGYSVVLNHIKGLIKTPWPPLNQAIESIGKVSLKSVLGNATGFKRNLGAYSEGLGIKLEETAYALVMPEIVSCMSKWVPGMKFSGLGCSSYFIWDEVHNAPVHGRVLDFPLLTTFDRQERAVIYDFKNSPKIFSFGTNGFPYPSITAMTENGVTLSLHQKFTDVFNRQGTPIFEIVYELLRNCGDRKSAIEFLKSSQSLTTWAFYMSFENGDVLAADLMGDELYTNFHQIEPNKVIYLCNKLENPALIQEDYLPFGMDSYNSMRCKIADKKIEEFSKTPYTDSELIKMMATPLNQSRKKAANWNCDTVTMSSLQIATMMPVKERALFIPGEAPKFYQKEILSFEGAFSNLKQSLFKGKKSSTNPKYRKGMREMMLSQVAHDNEDFHEAYHHLQMAISYLKGLPEQNIATFFFLVLQYIHEKHQKMRFHLLEEFKHLVNNLPPYLNDHCLLFVARLEKSLTGKISVSVEQIKNDHLKKVFDFELKIHRKVIHKTTSVLMNPRLDLLDIIYAHVNTR